MLHEHNSLDFFFSLAVSTSERNTFITFFDGSGPEVPPGSVFGPLLIVDDQSEKPITWMMFALKCGGEKEGYFWWGEVVGLQMLIRVLCFIFCNFPL